MNSNAVNIPVLLWQIVIVTVSVGAIFLFATSFPYPSPLIKPLLSPQKRWPTQQIKQTWGAGQVPQGFLDFFLRDPDRDIPPGSNVVAPADGVIRNITRKPDWTYIDIALTFWDVHVQRSPVTGTVVSVENSGDTFMDGEFKDMVYLREKTAPVQKIITLESEFGTLKIRLITSLMAQRIRVWVHAGDHLEKGERVAKILLGSTVILQLPPDMPLSLKKGDRVAAGESFVSVPNR